MKDIINREVAKEEGVVYLVSTEIKDISREGRKITQTKVTKSEATKESLVEYELDRKLQFDNFKTQEKENNAKIKDITKRLKKFINQRGYKSFKKNWTDYNIYEGFIKQDIPVETIFSKDKLKDFNKYKKNRDKLKDFYVTYLEEQSLEVLENNKEAFNDIWKEDKMFVNQLKKAEELLK